MSEKSVGLICAIPQELGHLEAALESASRSSLYGFEFVSGRLDGRPVVLAETGIGKVNAATVATLLLAQYEVGALVFSGVAGGLDPALAVGDVVVSQRVLQHDCGVIEGEKLATYQAGHIPFFNPTSSLGHEVETQLLTKVRAALEGVELPALASDAGGSGRSPRLAYGTILTGDQYIHCEATRQRLHVEFEACAVAMEGAAVAQVAERAKLPWLEVRALSDLAGVDSSFDFGRFVSAVAANSASILRRALRAF